MTLRQFLNGVRYGSPDGPAVVIDWDNRTVAYKRTPARMVMRLERWRHQGDVDAASPAEQVRRGLDYIRTTYGGDAQ